VQVILTHLEEKATSAAKGHADRHNLKIKQNVNNWQLTKEAKDSESFISLN